MKDLKEIRERPNESFDWNLATRKKEGACSDCALVVVPCAFSDMVATLRGRRKGKPVFSRQVQGVGAALLPNAGFVAGPAVWRWWRQAHAVNRDFWTCGSFTDFVAGAALCEPRSADFAAGTALCEPRSGRHSTL